MKHSKPAMGICLKCRNVRVLSGGVCRDCRAATTPPPANRTPDSQQPSKS
jgi:hypothetical protein